MTFKTDIATDLDVFFNTDEFADSAVYDYTSTISVIFEEAALVILNGIETIKPTADAKTSDITGVKHGKTLKISDTTYYVIGIEKQDSLITKLILSKNK